MRTFIFTYDRYDTLTTPMMMSAEGIEHTVLCHTDEAREKFIAGGRVDEQTIIATGEPKGLANNRNAALDMMADGEWALFFVDDLIRVQELDGYDDYAELGTIPITMKNQAEWRKRFEHEITLNDLLRRSEKNIRFAEKMGANLVGFAGFANPMFRANRWKVNCLADGRAWLVRKTDLRFDTNVQLIDDVCWTAQNIVRFGAVLVDAWVLPDCRRYTKGAYGTIEQRLQQKRAEVDYLVSTYPQVCATKKKAGWPDGTHVVIRPPRR